jgi:exodeoxyribonuclease VII large subunit
MASPARAELLGRLAECARRVTREMRRRLEYAMQAADACARRLVHPAERLRGYHALATQLSARLGFSFLHHVHACEAKLARLQAALAGLDPTAVLGRGYSITYAASGEVLRDAAQVRPGERLRTRLGRGHVDSEVKKGEDS